MILKSKTISDKEQLFYNIFFDELLMVKAIKEDDYEKQLKVEQRLGKLYNEWKRSVTL